jgi:hypothetical protein
MLRKRNFVNMSKKKPRVFRAAFELFAREQPLSLHPQPVSG